VKKFLAVVAIVLALAVYFESTRYSVGLGGFSAVLDEDRHDLEQGTRGFLTAIQYKDFQKAASYHHPDEREKFDIAKMIEEKFYIKPEHLDIRHFETLRVDVDPEGVRGKVMARANLKVLNAGKVKDVEAVFYWKKTDGKWFLGLRSSL
jgi:hypothetical protein